VLPGSEGWENQSIKVYDKANQKKLRLLPQSMGVDLVRRYPHDFDRHLLKFIERARPSTMTSPERLYSLCKAVEYITKNRIPGDIVECGVWRGGSMVAVALTLVALNETTRSLWLYDTFEGMTPPTNKDVRIVGGELADKLLAESSKDNRRSRKSIWCYAPLEEVQRNMADISYGGPIHYIKGPASKCTTIDGRKGLHFKRRRAFGVGGCPTSSK
jgi:O-methyltransferase